MPFNPVLKVTSRWGLNLLNQSIELAEVLVEVAHNNASQVGTVAGWERNSRII